MSIALMLSSSSMHVLLGSLALFTCAVYAVLGLGYTQLGAVQQWFVLGLGWPAARCKY
jgi:hypothetical protein